MSVLIRGMQLPRDCQFCKLAHWNTVNMLTGCDAVVGKRCADTHDLEFCTCDGRPSWCPLIEVPPHGRLIDADVMIKRYEPDINRQIYGGNFIHDLEYATTVIPADKDGDNNG